MLIACVAMALLAPAASAHDELVSSSLQSDEALDQAPTEVVLTFSGEPLELGTTAMVTDLDGTDHATSTTVDGHDAVIAIGPLEDGFYDVRWRVVSSDGHPLSGIIPFSVGPAEEIGARPSGSAQPGDATANATANATASEAPAAAQDPASTSGRPVLRTLGIALGGAVLALALWWIVGSLPARRTASKDAP